MAGNTKLSTNMSYYNALVGSWEPIIEQFEVELNLIKKDDGSKDISFKVDRDLNINITESLLKTMMDALRSMK